MVGGNFILGLEHNNTYFVWTCYLNSVNIGEIIAYTMLASQLTDKLGRVSTIRLSMIVAVVGNVLQAMSRFPHFWWLLILGRFVVGLSFGLFIVCASTFVVEASPPQMIGQMVVVLTSGSVLGSLVGSVLGMKNVLGNCLRNTVLTLYCNSLKSRPHIN